jgi:hypothetical protein
MIINLGNQTYFININSFSSSYQIQIYGDSGNLISQTEYSENFVFDENNPPFFCLFDKNKGKYVIPPTDIKNITINGEESPVNYNDFLIEVRKIFFLTDCGGSASWGGITGDLSAQTDLQTALNLKANAKLQNINEVYIDYTNGNNTTGLGTFDKPYADLTQGLVLAGANSNIYLNTGIENAKTFTISQNNVKINGAADNLVFNSDSGFGSTLISNSTINATKRAVFENINFSNTILSITGIVKFNNCKIEDSLQITGSNATVIFDNCYVPASIALQNIGTNNILILLPNCTGYENLSIGTIPSSWVLQDKYATETSGGLMSKDSFIELIFLRTNITVVDSGFNQPENPITDTSVDFVFTAQNFNCFPYHPKVTAYSSIAGNNITLPNFETSNALSIEYDGDIIEIQNHSSSTKSINILVPNGRIIRTSTGNVFSYTINIDTAEKFRYHHSDTLTNRYFELL